MMNLEVRSHRVIELGVSFGEQLFFSCGYL